MPPDDTTTRAPGNGTRPPGPVPGVPGPYGGPSAGGGGRGGPGAPPFRGSSWHGNGGGRDPFAAPPARPWYRRPGAIAAAVIVVVVGAAVVADLPQHSTRAQQASTIASVLKSINTDIHSCTFAASEAFTIHHKESAGSLTPSELANVSGYLRDDQVACSMTDQSVVELGTLTLPQTPAGRQLGTAIRGVLEWESSDAVAAIEDLQTLHQQPHDPTALADLAKQERLLATDRGVANKAVRAASRDLGGAHIGTLALPRLPSPS